MKTTERLSVPLQDFQANSSSHAAPRTIDDATSGDYDTSLANNLRPPVSSLNSFRLFSNSSILTLRIATELCQRCQTSEIWWLLGQRIWVSQRAKETFVQMGEKCISQNEEEKVDYTFCACGHRDCDGDAGACFETERMNGYPSKAQLQDNEWWLFWKRSPHGLGSLKLVWQAMHWEMSQNCKAYGL